MIARCAFPERTFDVPGIGYVLDECFCLALDLCWKAPVHRANAPIAFVLDDNRRDIARINFRLPLHWLGDPRVEQRRHFFRACLYPIEITPFIFFPTPPTIP